MKKDNNTKKQNKMTEQETAEKKNKMSFMTTFICIFLSILLVFGATLGAMVMVRDARAMVKYDGVVVDKGEVIFLASRYKSMYLRTLNLSGVHAADSPTFWAMDSGNGETYGALYEKGLQEYIASVLVGNSLFNKYAKYTNEDKRKVAAAIEEVVLYRADGSVSKFNSLVEQYGFDYSDFQHGCELLYKATYAKNAIYGKNGENLSGFTSECNEYLKTYTRVSLLFLRTDTKVVEDENTGELKTEDLSSAEVAARAELIASIRDHIDARASGDSTRPWITPQMLELNMKNSDGDPTFYTTGYYLNPSAEVTADFATTFPTIVERAFELEIGEYGEAEWEFGTCFIYRDNVVDGAYKSEDNYFFSDFYSDAADYLYAQTLDLMAPDAVFSEDYGLINVLSIPDNDSYYVKEWD